MGSQPTFVLVPGAGGDSWYWHRVVDELTRRGHWAVAVDLPATDDGAGLQAYAGAIAAAAAPHRPVVLVAHSMGALSAPLVCALVPVDLLVLVNAMIPLPGQTGAAWWETSGFAEARAQQVARDGRTSGVDDVDPAEDFLHDLPAHVLAEAVDRGDIHQSARPFADPFPLTRWPDVPTRVVVGRDDRFFPASFQRRLAMERLGVTADEVPGGHLVALARPVELTDQLLACWQDLSCTPASSSPS